MGILEEEWLEPRTSTAIPVVKWSKSSKAEGCYVNGNQNLTRLVNQAELSFLPVFMSLSCE